MSKFDSSDANLGQAKKGYALGENSVHAKEVWNAAIEAVITLINSDAHYDTAACAMEGEIRKLKK